MRAARRLLVRAWRRDARAWWHLTTGLLAVVLLIVVGVAGLLEGMNRETEARIADFYTGDVRLTAGRPAAAPDAYFDLGNASIEDAIARVDAAGGTLEPRVETTYILSRRSLVEAYLFEDEQFTVEVPGGDADGEQFTAGILLGLAPGGPSLDRIREHLVTGGLPNAAVDGEPVELLMSQRNLRLLLSDAEHARIGDWPPSASELSSFRFELTAGRIDDSGSIKDILRTQARVVGLFDSRIEALDRVTLVTTIADARALLGGNETQPQANVLVAYGGKAAALSAAEEHGLRSEGAAHFAHRYLGQLVDVVRALSLAISLLLLGFPVFLLWYGMSQQLERSQRELGVCRAIGLPTSMLARALARLAGGVIGVAALAVALLAGLGLVVLPGLLADWRGLPLPVSFAVPLWVALVTLGSLLLGGTLAVLGTVRRHANRDLASTLRAP